MARGISFEVDLGVAYVPHYGTAAISARVLFRKVADGAGHLSDHYDLSQIYAASDVYAGNGRRRLRCKTRPTGSMADRDDVKLGKLWQHKSTIAAANGKHPAMRARALSTVLRRDYGLLVKWKALQTYVLRECLWTASEPKPPSSWSPHISHSPRRPLPPASHHPLPKTHA